MPRHFVDISVALENGIKSNADQVAKIKRIVEDLSLEVATPAEARERLALKGGDMVKF
tara:strand:- start:4838 stop:5011 length:174 start_codon:yes stop_codon:yes gene_type:complete